MGPQGNRNKKSGRGRVRSGAPPPPLASNVEQHSPSSSSTSSFECPVCFNAAEFFSVGLCNHSICQECSVRMRVLLDADECPICRQQLREVYHSRELLPFPKMSSLQELMDKKSGIRFQGEDAKARFRALKRHVCTVCKENPPEFDSFNQLETHCKREHELFYCQLCSEHLKLFTHERRLYTRSQLATHRRKGDIDDKSHKGHPECKFCAKRFMDNEALFLHLRKEHFSCHFCDSDGNNNVYYPNYNALREHFGLEHYLCTEGACLTTQFTQAFRTEIDFKAHRLEAHGNTFSKYDALMNRTVGLDLNYKNSRGGSNKSNRGGSGREGSKRNNNANLREIVPPIFDEPIQHQQVIPDVNSAENFPSLGGAGGGISRSVSGNELASTKGKKSGGSKWKAGNGASRGEDFPSLGMPSNPAPSGAAPKGRNVAQRIRESEFSNGRGKKTSTVWGNEVPSQPRANKPVPKPPKPMCEDFPGLDPPARGKKNGVNGKKGKKKDDDDDFGDIGGFLRSAADVISSSDNDWSVVSSNKQSNAVKKQQKLANSGGEGSIPGLKYASRLGSGSSRNFIDEESQSTQDTSEDYPSLGPCSSKITAHFRPNTRDPIPTQWDNVASPDLFLPTEASGAKPKTAIAPRPQKITPAPANNIPVNASYNPPNDFCLRNKRLLSTIMKILGGKSLEFKEFVNISKKFRDESISSAEFYDKCIYIVGSGKVLMEFLPELIFLLPEIKKQQELLSVHQRKNAALKIPNLQKCDKCNQILSVKDISQHDEAHSLDGDFPSLFAS